MIPGITPIRILTIPDKTRPNGKKILALELSAMWPDTNLEIPYATYDAHEIIPIWVADICRIPERTAVVFRTK